MTIALGCQPKREAPFIGLCYFEGNLLVRQVTEPEMTEPEKNPNSQ
jgi:hypothetical protein